MKETISDLKLEDLTDIKQFQILLDKLNDVNKFPSAIIDTTGKILVSTAWQDICTKFHRQNSKSKAECKKSDSYILSHLNEANPYVSYRCPHGMTEIAFPIIIEGKHLANFFTGQFFLEQPDIEFYKKQAEKYGFNEKKYFEALSKVPVWTQEKLDNHLAFIEQLVKILIDKGQKNLIEIKNQKIIDSQKTDLKISKEKFESYFDNNKAIMLQLNTVTKQIINANEAAVNFYGYSKDELLQKSINDLNTLSLDKITAKMNEAIKNKSNFYQFQHKLADNQIRDVEVYSSTFDNNNQLHMVVTIHDITQREKIKKDFKKQYEKLKLNQFYLKKAQEIGIVGTWEIDLRNNKLFWTDETYKIFGIAPGTEITYEIFLKKVHPDDKISVDKQLTAALKNEPYDIEYRIIVNNKVKWVTEKAEIRFNKKGEAIKALGFIQDITKRVKSEEAIKESEYLLRKSQETGRVGSYSLDISSGIWKSSVALDKIFGIDENFKKDIAGWLAIIYPEDRDKMQKYFMENVLTEQDIFDKEYRIQKINTKQELWVHGIGDFEFDDKGNLIKMIGTIQDITEQKKNEQELMDLNEEYVALNEELILSRDESQLINKKLFDVTTAFKESDKKQKEILNSFVDGFYITSPGYEIEYLNSIMAQQFPDAKTGQKCYNALYGRNKICDWCVFDKLKKDTFIIYELKYPGSNKYFNVKNLFLNNNSKITTFHDITALKEKELLLKTQNEELNKLNTAVRQSPLTIIITDTKGNIEYTNPKFTDITGYTPEEVIGENPRILKSEEQDEKFYKNLWDTICNGNIWTGEFRNKKKSGQLYWEEATIGPIKNNLGEITHFISLKADITEKKKIEQRLKKSEEHFRKIFEKSLIGMYVTEKSGKIIMANKAFYEMLGYNSFEEIKQVNLETQKSLIGNRRYFTKKIDAENFLAGFESVWYKKTGEKIYVRESARKFEDEKGQIFYEGTVENITAWKLADKALKEIQNFNEKIIKIGRLGYATYNKNGKCLTANDSYSEIMGGTHEQVLDQNFNHIKSWDKSGLKRNANRCLKEGIKIKTLFEGESMFNKSVGLEINLSRLYKNEEVQLLVILKDISSILKARRRQLQIKSEFSKLINTVNVPVFGINRTGIINEWNNCLEDLSGYSHNEVKNKKFATQFIDTNIQTLINKSQEGKELSNIKFMLHTKDNNTVNLLLSTTIRRNRHDEIEGIICVGQDITEIEDYQIKLEKTVEERTTKLIEALKKEKELSNMKSQFVSMTSHEFRTPIAAISFTAGLIKKHWEKINDTDRTEKLKKIEEQAMLLNSLLDDILTYNKAESKTLKFKLIKTNIYKLLLTFIEEVRVSTKRTHEINFEFNNKNADVLIDKMLARNIFNNLMINAVKFSPDSNHIDVKLRESNSNVIIEIIDYGIGINPEEYDHIFTPFQRGQNAENIQGTGLGLAIVQESIELLKGNITFESKINEGTKFLVSIPIKL